MSRPDNTGYTILDRVELLLRRNNLMRPSETMIGMGESFLPIAKGLMNIEAGEERFASIGYYIYDIIPHCGDVRAKYNPRGEILTNSRANVLFFNLLFVELLADLSMFQSNNNKEAMCYILGKYSRLFAAVSNPSAAGFYHWLFSMYKNENALDYRAYLPQAGAGSLFLVMHEWQHSQPDLVINTERLLISSEESERFYRSLTKKEQEEVCCDYSALAMFSQYGYERFFQCSKTEAVGIAMLSLSVAGVHDLFGVLAKSFRGVGGELGELLVEFLKKRITILAVAIKLSCNGNLFFGDCDVMDAAHYALEPVIGLFEKIGDFYRRDLIGLIEQYNSMTEEEQEEYSFSPPYHGWTLFA